MRGSSFATHAASLCVPELTKMFEGLLSEERFLALRHH